MRYLTDRKRAEGTGAAHTGTEHAWYMRVSAFGLALIMPLFIYVMAGAIGGSHAEVLATFSKPGPAILTGLVLVFGLQHFQKGAMVMIEDYSHGAMRRVLIMLLVAMIYGLTATGLYALVKIAL
jgi:succinate dehydrogenase / fumarate reductase membrane anchor subunit